MLFRSRAVREQRQPVFAHTFRAGENGLTLLAYGTREPGDVCFYPRSNKLSFRGVGVIGRIEQLDYWDGED